MSDLRLVGTVFEHEYPPDLTTTDWEKSTKRAVFTYRVTAHVSVVRFAGDEVGELAEQVEVIAVRYEDQKEEAS